jgi:septal ring factor EnvC (AmiA/AmiB activator)
MPKMNKTQTQRAAWSAELKKQEEGRDLFIAMYEKVLAEGNYSQDQIIALQDRINLYHDDIADIEGQIESLDKGWIRDKGDYMDSSSEWHY